MVSGNWERKGDTAAKCDEPIAVVVDATRHVPFAFVFLGRGRKSVLSFMTSEATRGAVALLMATHALAHRCDVCLPCHHIHRENFAVTGLALEMRVEMSSVIPENPAGNFANAHPGDPVFSAREVILNTR